MLLLVLLGSFSLKAFGVLTRHSPIQAHSYFFNALVIVVKARKGDQTILQQTNVIVLLGSEDWNKRRVFMIDTLQIQKSWSQKETKVE